jgi:hypothetical protein
MNPHSSNRFASQPLVGSHSPSWAQIVADDLGAAANREVESGEGSRRLSQMTSRNRI